MLAKARLPGSLELASADAAALVERLEEVAARQGVAAPGPAKVKVRAARWSGGVPRW